MKNKQKISQIEFVLGNEGHFIAGPNEDGNYTTFQGYEVARSYLNNALSQGRINVYRHGNIIERVNEQQKERNIARLLARATQLETKQDLCVVVKEEAVESFKQHVRSITESPNPDWHIEARKKYRENLKRYENERESA